MKSQVLKLLQKQRYVDMLSLCKLRKDLLEAE